MPSSFLVGYLPYLFFQLLYNVRRAFTKKVAHPISNIITQLTSGKRSSDKKHKKQPEAKDPKPDNLSYSHIEDWIKYFIKVGNPDVLLLADLLEEGLKIMKDAKTDMVKQRAFTYWFRMWTSVASIQEDTKVGHTEYLLLRIPRLRSSEENNLFEDRMAYMMKVAADCLSIYVVNRILEEKNVAKKKLESNGGFIFINTLFFTGIQRIKDKHIAYYLKQVISDQLESESSLLIRGKLALNSEDLAVLYGLLGTKTILVPAANQ